MTDDHQTASVSLEEVAKPDDRVGVEVVGGLVQQQRLRAGEENAGELDPAALAAGERAQRLPQHSVGKTETGRHLGGLRLRCEPAGRVQLRIGGGVATHSSVAGFRVVAAHLVLCIAQSTHDVVDAPGGEDPVAREHVEVSGPRVLRQVADRPVRVTSPPAGKASPARIRVMVVFPAPLRPTRPIWSPGPIRNDVSSTRIRAPART